MTLRYLFGLVVLSGLALVSCSENKEGSEPDPEPVYSVTVQTETQTVRYLRADTISENPTVSLTAARNEWESFQIILRADENIPGVTVQAGDLTGPGGETISTLQARLYRQHQFEILNPSHGVQDFEAGWYPDGLIPFNHPITGVALDDPDKLLAVPFELPADQTHGFLVDLHIPPTVSAGVYTGTYQVLSGDTLVRDIAVSLTVYDFSLPDRKSLFTDFGAPQHQMTHLAWTEGNSFSDAYWKTVSNQCNELVRRHGINPVLRAYSVYFSLYDLEADGSFSMGNLYRTTIQEFLDTHRPNAVRLPFRGTPTIKEVVFGNSGFNENTYQSDDFTETGKNRLINYLQSWETVIAGLSGTEDILFYVYLCDEPNSKNAYAFVRDLGTTIRNSGLNRIKVLVVEQSRPDVASWGNLYGAIDVWVPFFSSFNEVSATDRQDAGEMFWTYTALTTWGGGLSWQTDLPLLNHRIPTWIAWSFDMKGLLYWSMAYWWGEAYPDLWNNATTFENVWQGTAYYYNGDGVLVYPAEDVGYYGIAPSLRLKAIRDGIEDFEYLVQAQNLGLEADVRTMLGGLFSSFTDFNASPDAYDQAREDIAELIEVFASQHKYR